MSGGNENTTKYAVSNPKLQWIYVLGNDLLYLRNITYSSETLGKDESLVLTGYICELSTIVDMWVDKYIKTSEQDVDHDRALSELGIPRMLSFYTRLSKLVRFLQKYATDIKSLTAEDSLVLQRMYDMPLRTMDLIGDSVADKFCCRLHRVINIVMDMIIDGKLYVNNKSLVSMTDTLLECTINYIVEDMKEREHMRWVF